MFAGRLREGLLMLEANLKPYQTSKMECFGNIINGLHLLTNFTKCSLLDI